MKEAVALAACGDYQRETVEEAVGRALDLLGGAASIVRPEQSVFVKTNAVLAQPPESAMTTHPEVVRALVRELQQVTPDVTVGDSPGGPFTPSFLRRVYEKTGIAQVARDTGCKLGMDTRVIEVACPDGVAVKRLELCRAMVEADVLVSVAKLKSHRFLNVTGPVKNLYGTVPGMTKMSYHSRFENGDDFADLIVDVHLAAVGAVGAAFHLLDAVDVIEGDGARRGTIKRMGALAAGRSAFAVESLILELAGLPPGTSKPLEAAVRRGACPTGTDWFEVLGDPPDSFHAFKERSFALPAENVFGEKTLARITARWTRLFAVTPYPLPGACTRCGRCVEICPRGAISLGPGAGRGVGAGRDDPARVDPRKCIRCFCCDELCEFKAIEMRRPWPARLRLARLRPS